jgi:hypothetical protein
MEIVRFAERKAIEAQIASSKRIRTSRIKENKKGNTKKINNDSTETAFTAGSLDIGLRIATNGKTAKITKENRMN